MMKQFENMNTFGKDGLEAYVASATAMTKGFQTLAGEMAEFSRKSFEKSTSTVEQTLAAKSVDKAMEVQKDAAKEAGEAYVAELTKLGEIYTDVAKEAFKPFEASIAQFTKAASAK